MRVTEVGILKSASEFEIPLVTVRAPCGTGFPSSADDYAEEGFDLNQYVTEHPEATLYVRAEGDSMIGAGIFDGDILVVDKALVNNAKGRVITAWYYGHFTVKRLYTDPRLKQSFLISENPKYPPIELHPETDFIIWVVVTWNLHKQSRELSDDVKSILFGTKK